jgi:hypothetical protein
MTTGIGCWLMSFLRNVSPSMRGISMSRVMTSGTCSLMRSAATNGSPAVAITSISGSDDKHLAQRLAHHGGVVHNQYANLRIGHERDLVSCLLQKSIGSEALGVHERKLCRAQVSRLSRTSPVRC